MYEENVNKLKEYLGFDKKMKHNKGEKLNLLPFVTRNPERVVFKEGFDSIVGEFCRLITNQKMSEDFSPGDAIKNIKAEKIDFDEPDMRLKFKKIVEGFVYPEGNLEILSPQLFLYLPLSDSKQRKGEKEIALFLKDVLWQRDEKIIDFFMKNETENVLIKYFINNFNYLNGNEADIKYDKKLSYISDFFMEDFKYLVEHESYFIENFHLLLSYYYFYYITQMFMVIRKEIDVDHHKLYYILNWESASKKRKSYEVGYGEEINNSSKKLLTWVYAMEYLNFIFGVEGNDFSELKNIYNDLSETECSSLIKVLKSWIIDYRENRGLSEIGLSDDYNELEGALINSIDEAIGDATKARYRLSLNEIGKKYFLKSRGSLSFVGNITQDFLLFLTTICVKDKRIKVKELFNRYEKRGVYFDRYSKKEVLNFLNKLNVLDKKSDSGDAQYVKPIL